MASKLIQLEEDDILVEVEIPGEQTEEISGGTHFVDKVQSTLNRAQTLIVKTCKPIASAMKELNQEMEVEGVEVEIGLSFESEGNLYITKSKAGANLTVKMILKPKK
jgi:hypothetical protein